MVTKPIFTELFVITIKYSFLKKIAPCKRLHSVYTIHVYCFLLLPGRQIRTVSNGSLNWFLSRFVSFSYGIIPTNLYPYVRRKIYVTGQLFVNPVSDKLKDEFYCLFDKIQVGS